MGNHTRIFSKRSETPSLRASEKKTANKKNIRTVDWTAFGNHNGRIASRPFSETRIVAGRVDRQAGKVIRASHTSVEPTHGNKPYGETRKRRRRAGPIGRTVS